jgi:hypothetical protein
MNMETKHLNFGVYEATDAFRAIQQHSCVCFDDLGLVAVTGPAEDKEAQEYAELFAAAPDLLKALVAICDLTHDSTAETDNKVRYDAFRIAANALKVFGINYMLHSEAEQSEPAEFPVYCDAQGNEHREF